MSKQPQVEPVGNDDERSLFKNVHDHYITSQEDLDIRTKDFDKKDILFRSHIDEANWPYQSMVFDPRIFTTIYEKTARTFANKPRGRMLPREGGDVLKAKICNEILNFQWDDNERADTMPMLAKWAMMDLNTRKYGSSFAYCPWYWKRQVTGKGKDAKSSIFFDGPNFKPWNNRDVLVNPAYSSIRNWIQLRDYVTTQDLKNTNDAARSKPVYKNLDLLLDQLKLESEKSGDRRDANYTSKNKAIKGLTDYLGSDEVFKTIEIVTEYREDRWITFAPKHGVILRDIPNPYDHGQIPVVQLKYYPIDDDIYGLSEIEPVEKLQRAVNALVCQYLDAINMSLYAPLKVNSTGGAVQMHTLEFGPGKKWLMTNPASDVVTHDQNITGVTEFTSTYRFMIGAMQEALGDTSAAASNLVPGESKKTATEIKDTSQARSARDNFNQIFLAEAMKKQMMFWHKMDQQLLFSNQADQQKVIQIAGKDALRFFQKVGLDKMALNEEGQDLLASEDMIDTSATPEDMQTPLYPVQTEAGIVPKLELDEAGEMGNLIIEPGDLTGNYDYIPDIGSMSDTANGDAIKAKSEAIALLTANPQVAQMMMSEQKRVKVTELIVDYLEDIGFKNADQYIEALQPQGGMNALDQTGGDPLQQGQPGMGNVPNQGMAGGLPPVPNGQAQPILS